MDKVKLYFDEKLHKYTDDKKRPYTSMTTVIGKYEVKFDSKKMAAIVSRKQSSMYYGMSVTAILKLWDEMNKESLAKGNKKHNFLEMAVKKASGYKIVEDIYINGLIYTVDDIIENPDIGLISLEEFNKILDNKYPKIYNLVTQLVSNGYRIYSEVGVYSPELLISGLIDILLYNPANGTFIILDWKTNKHDMIPYDDERYKWLSGYFKKDKFGNITNKYVLTNTYFKPPLNKLQQSTYVEYALQLSGYTYLCEGRGLKCEDIILCHIRDFTYSENEREELVGKEVTQFHRMPYLKEYVERMFYDHYNKYGIKQTQMLI